MPDRVRPGFTLIELLVVVAIIALLISILLPSMAQARRQTKRQVCASNLHQLAIALHHYVNDNKDWFPLLRPWPHPPMVWTYGGKTGTEFWGGGYPAEVRQDKRPMNKYLLPEYYRCTEDRGLPGAYGATTFYDARGTSYPLNGYNEYQTGLPLTELGVLSRKSSQITNPLCVVAGDSVMDEYYVNNPGYGFRWHDDGRPLANLAYADGSVRYVLMAGDDVPRKLYWWDRDRYSFHRQLRKDRMGVP